MAAVWISGDDYSGPARTTGDVREFNPEKGQREKWARKRAKARAKRKPAAVDVVKANPLAWQAALRSVNGDVSRLTVNRDGSVTIHNNPQRKRISDDG